MRRFRLCSERTGIRPGYGEVLEYYVEGDILLTFSPDGNSILDIIPDLVAMIREDYARVSVLF
jgi:hypothetical protein